MRFTTRTAVLVAALSLPLGAALASYAFAADPPHPQVPTGVEIGEDATVDRSAGTGSVTPPTTTTPPKPKPKPPPAKQPAPPATRVVPPPPPVSDDDDDGDDRGEDDGGGDDDGDD